MKKTFNRYSLLLLLAVATTSSCNQDEILASYKESYVSFDRATLTIPEATVVSSAAKVDTKIGAQSNITITRSNIKEAQVVTFTLSGVFKSSSAFAAAGDDASATYFVSAQGSNGNYSLEIPAGQPSASFFIRSNDDLFSSGDKVISIEITGAGSLAIGRGSSQVNKKLTVTIADDDCPINIASWVGVYTVKEVFSTPGVNAGLTLAGAFGESYQVELSLDPTDGTGTKVLIKNSPGFDTYFTQNTVMSFVTCTKQIRFDAGNPNLALFAVFTPTVTSYNEVSFEIKASGPLGNFGQYEFSLKKK
jgi:hypothetical protein